jgi:hypothetical protein
MIICRIGLFPMRQPYRIIGKRCSRETVACITEVFLRRLFYRSCIRLL